MLYPALRATIGSLFLGGADAATGQDPSIVPFSRGDYSQGLDLSSGDIQSDMGRFLAANIVGNSLKIGWLLGELWTNPASRIPYGSVSGAGAIVGFAAFVVATAIVAEEIVDTTYEHGGSPHLTSYTGQMSGKYFDY